MRLEFFNTFDLGARVLLEENPLWPSGADAASAPGRLVIVGVGRLVVQADEHARRAAVRTGVTEEVVSGE